MTHRKPAPLLGEYLDLAAMKAAADEDRRPRGSAPSLLEEFLDVPADAPRVTGRGATAAEIRAERVRRDIAERLGLPDGEAA